MSSLALAAWLHLQTSDPWEIIALIGPFAIVFGAGIVLVIIPIVRSGGERYEHIEYRADEKQTARNGNEHGSGGGGSALSDAEPARPPAPWKS